jgi:hypothetical protein
MERYDRLEKEHRNLIARLERLEKQKSSIGGFIGAVLVLVAIGILADYLGFVPPPVEALPLRARIGDFNELVLRGEDGKHWGKIRVSGQKVVIAYLDTAGRTMKEEPLFAK